MSYEDKIVAIRNLLDSHNKAFNQEFNNTPGQVNPDEFITCLKFQGATNEEFLRKLGYEEIEACFPSNNGIKPKILVKEVAKICRDKPDEGNGNQLLTEHNTNNIRVKVKDMNPLQLIQSFDPEEPDSQVAERLKKVSNGQKFIVFNNGRAIDVDTTYKLLLEVKTGNYSGRDTIEINGELKKVYNIGELPDNYADENPLYPGRPLRPDGTCDQTNRSWAGVSLDVKQIVYLAVKNKELDLTVPNGMLLANDIIQTAVASQDAFKRFQSTFKTAALKFIELSKTNSLPKLKIELGSSKNEGKPPFEDGKKVVWATRPSSQETKRYYAYDTGHKKWNLNK